MSQGNLTKNKYGAGVYLAKDARSAQCLIRASRRIACITDRTTNATVGDLQAERLVAFGIDNCRSTVNTSSTL